MTELTVATSGPLQMHGEMTRWDRAQVNYYNPRLLDAAAPHAAALLTRYIFDAHPYILDLPPDVNARLGQAQQVMASYEDGGTLLQHSVYGHFKAAEDGLEQGYASAATAVIRSANLQDHSIVVENGRHVRHVALPSSVQERALVWNRWMQERIVAGNMTEVFGRHPEWVGVKLAEGSWLQVGNLMVEATEGLARIRTRVHYAADAEKQLGLSAGSKEWGAGLDDWYLMTHIMDKELLDLAERVGGPDMIDGRRLTTGVYARSYASILEVMRSNRQLGFRGVLSDGTWAYSAELARLFPEQHVSQLHDIAGRVVELGPAAQIGMPAQIDFATHDPLRRESYNRGKYGVGVAARFIGEVGMQQVVDQHLDS